MESELSVKSPSFFQFHLNILFSHTKRYTFFEIYSQLLYHIQGNNSSFFQKILKINILYELFILLTLVLRVAFKQHLEKNRRKRTEKHSQKAKQLPSREGGKQCVQRMQAKASPQ